MKARSPRIGDEVDLGTGRTTIMSFELYQPNAPKAFEVECADGVTRAVRWNNLRWELFMAAAEQKISHGGVKRTEEAEVSHGGSEGTEENNLDETPGVASQSLHPGDAQRPPLQLPKRRGRPPRSSPSRAWTALPIPKAVPSRPVRELTFEQARAHAALDEARDRYDRARGLDDQEAMARLGPAYHAAIARVNEIDPGFYLARRAR